VGHGHMEAVAAEEAWTRLQRDAGSVLIDVRTTAEWALVGVADLASIGKQPVLVEWQAFAEERPHAAFVERITNALSSMGASRDSELLFICRSGARSLRAAQAMAAAGFPRCRNVSDGFEGPLDAAGHRGRLGGWKAKGLPWTQS
jgi:rhodanese-related sulfurtransferase